MPCHRLLRGLLHVEVERQHDALPRMIRDFLQHTQPASNRIDLDLLAAGLAAQERFPSAFEAELPDLIAHLVAGLHEVVAVDLADIAEQMSRERAVEIMARGSDFEADTRQLQLMGFQRDDLRPFEVLIDSDGVVLGAAFVIGGIDFRLDAGLAEDCSGDSPMVCERSSESSGTRTALNDGCVSTSARCRRSKTRPRGAVTRRMRIRLRSASSMNSEFLMTWR